MKLSTRFLYVATALMIAQNANAAETPESVAPESAAASAQTKPIVISLEFSKALVVDALQVVAKQTGLTLVLGENVTGELPPIYLEDATPEHALSFIAKTANLAFRKIDVSTFAIGNVADDIITKSQAEKAAALRAEERKPRVTMSRTVKLFIEIRNTQARDVLQQIADENGLRLMFLDSPNIVIENLKIDNLSPEAAVEFIAKEVGFNAVAVTFREGQKNIRGFLLRDNKKVIVSPLFKPRTRVMPPYLRFDEPPRETDNLEELDPMVVKPPQDRQFHGLMPHQPRTAPPVQNDEKTAPR